MKKAKTKILVRKKNAKKGFTLIELLAVTVILSLILLLLSPKIISLLEKTKKQNCINNMQQMAKLIDLDVLDNNRSLGRKYEFGTDGIIGSKIDGSDQVKVDSKGKLILKGKLEYDIDGRISVDNIKCDKWTIIRDQTGIYKIEGETESPNTLGSLEITVKNEDTNTKLSNVKFVLRDSSDNNLGSGEATSGSNGIATITNIPLGKHKLVMTQSPSGYDPASDKEVEIKKGTNSISINLVPVLVPPVGKVVPGKGSTKVIPKHPQMPTEPTKIYVGDEIIVTVKPEDKDGNPIIGLDNVTITDPTDPEHKVIRLIEHMGNPGAYSNDPNYVPDAPIIKAPVKPGSYEITPIVDGEKGPSFVFKVTPALPNLID